MHILHRDKITTIQSFSIVFRCMELRQQPRSIKTKVNIKKVLNKVLSIGIKKCCTNIFGCNLAGLTGKFLLTNCRVCFLVWISVFDNYFVANYFLFGDYFATLPGTCSPVIWLTYLLVTWSTCSGKSGKIITK